MDYTKKHDLSIELDSVHKRMIAKYKIEQEAQKDIKRAQRMEQYLRNFKAAGNAYFKDKQKPSYQLGIENQAMEQLAKEVGMALGLGQKKGYSLFRWSHQAGMRAGIKGVDDVFEAELSKLLQIAAEKATGQKNITNTGVEVVGNMVGNINKEFLEELQLQGNSIIKKNSKISKLIQSPEFRAAKVDVTGYSSEFIVSSSIRPQWFEFINLFRNAKMTLKNYSSTSATETIHLGKTNPTKAILGSLSNLGYNPKHGTHIYYHLLGDKKNKEAHHIIHLRFTYELTGGGLYDRQGNRLDGADFFVYNDPASNNIWVRSTKAMISEMTKYTGSQFGDPFHSNVIIFKQAFI